MLRLTLPADASEPLHLNTPRQAEITAPSAVMRQHLVDHFDAQALRAGIEVTQPGVKSYSANTMFQVQPPHGAPGLAKVLAESRVQPEALAAFAHEQAGCVLAAQVGAGARVLHQSPRLLMTSYLAGHNLRGQKPLDWQPTRRALRQLRTFHTASHPAPSEVPAARLLLDKFRGAASKTEALKLISPARAAELTAQAERAHALLQRLGGDSATLVHGDFHAGNVRVTLDGHAYLIDLERWGRGEPAADLAHFATETQLGIQDQRRLLRGYAGHATPHLLARLRLCMFLVSAEHYMLWVLWNATEDWCKDAPWGPAKVPQTEALLNRGLRHLERYERQWPFPSSSPQ